MTTQAMMAFVQRGYDAYNAHQSDPHWLDYGTLGFMQQLGVLPTPG